MTPADMLDLLRRLVEEYELHAKRYMSPEACPVLAEARALVSKR